MVDIGGEGRQSDGGIFRDSSIGSRFEKSAFHLPDPQPIELDGAALPYVLVADEAFPLTNYMMRPYPRSGKLNLQKKVFNYRLSRARRVVENAFGILAARWRIYRRPIIANVDNVKTIVQATVVLHNFIIQSQENLQLQDTYTRITPQDVGTISGGLSSMPHCQHKINNGGIDIRNKYTAFFCSRNGALPFQWEKAMQNDL